MITALQLSKIYPYAKKGNIDIYVPFLNPLCEKYEVNTTLRLSAFLAQVGHESAQFRYVKELASGQAYEGRKDLGNTDIGDGVRFKGRGLIQVTGRANYTAISKDLGIDFVKIPELLEVPEYAIKSAFWFWNRKNLNKWADIPDFEKITRIINGGMNGYKDRLDIYERAKKIL